MNIVYVALLLLFIFLISDIINDNPLGATDFTVPDNRSLSLLNTDNENEILVLNGVTLIDGTDGPQKNNSVIIINNNKIIAVTSQNNYSSFNISNESLTNGRVLNLTGKYIMPGLFDMHAHVAGVRKNSYDQATSEEMLRMLLNYGVTTVRNPGGPTNETVQLREEVLNENLSGPEIFTAGRLLNTPEFPIPFVERQVTSEEEVRKEVRRQAAAGVDYIKLYVGLKPDLVKAAIDEAHSQGIKVIGHLYLTSWTDAAKSWN